MTYQRKKRMGFSQFGMYFSMRLMMTRAMKNSSSAMKGDKATPRVHQYID